MSRICLVIPSNKFDQYFIQLPWTPSPPPAN